MLKLGSKTLKPLWICIICSELSNETRAIGPEIAEILKDFMNTFCHYMKLPERAFDFRHEPFPFCKSCRLILVKLLKLHENNAEGASYSASKAINKVICSLTLKVLESPEYQPESGDKAWKKMMIGLGSNSIPGEVKEVMNLDEMSPEVVTICQASMKIILSLRKVICKRYDVQVRVEKLKPLPGRRVKETEGCELAEIAPKDPNPTPGPSGATSETHHGRSLGQNDASDEDLVPINVIKITGSHCRRVNILKSRRKPLEPETVEERNGPGRKGISLASSRPNKKPSFRKILSVRKRKVSKTSDRIAKTKGEIRERNNYTSQPDELVSKGGKIQHPNFVHLKSTSIYNVWSGGVEEPYHPTSKELLCLPEPKHFSDRNTSCESKEDPEHEKDETEKADCSKNSGISSIVKEPQDIKPTVFNKSRRKQSLLLRNVKDRFAAKNSGLKNGPKSGKPFDVTRSRMVKCIEDGKFVYDRRFLFLQLPYGYSCGSCDSVTKTITKMMYHIRYKHHEIHSRKLVCERCGKAFGTNSSFKLHQKSHSDVRPYKCSSCGRTFKTAQGFRQHKITGHSTTRSRVISKNFVCDRCGKRFCSNAMLKLHYQTHLKNSERNKYECKKCKKVFLSAMSLQTHCKSHDGVKPYSCKLCGMRFTQSYSVTRHNNVVHKNTKPSLSRKNKRTKPQPTESEEEEISWEESSEDTEIEISDSD